MSKTRVLWNAAAVRKMAVMQILLAVGLVRSVWGAPPLGINIDPPNDWSGNRAFADVMKTARAWSRLKSDPGAGDARVDAQGWPTEDAQCILWAHTHMDGTYKLSFTGKATVTTGWTPATIENYRYAPATNVSTADLIVREAGNAGLVIRFADTSGGVKQIKLMRPVAPGSARSYPTTTVFTDQLKRALEPFGVVRFKDFTGTDENHVAGRWSERVQPDTASFNRGGKGYGWQGRGAAWEYVILLANQLHKDAWICLPVRADDDYARHVALLFRDGNPAAGVPPLEPGLKLYVEFSNEVWNTTYEQTAFNHEQAVAEQQAGDRYRYNHDGNNNEWQWAWRRWLRRTADVSLIFRSVFGDAQMMARVRPVYAWQQGAGQDTGHNPLRYLEEAYLPLVAPGKPVKHVIYGGGGSAYYGPDNSSGSLNMDSVWSSDTMSLDRWKETQQKDNAICATYGLVNMAYEGGPGLDKTGHGDGVKAQAVRDPRMREAVLSHHRAWNRWNGDLLIYFTLTGDYQWGFTDDVLDLETPKMRAARELATQAREPLGLGRPVPGTTDGGSFDLGFMIWERSGSGSQKIKDGQSYSYVFKFPAAGTYEVAAEASVGGLWGWAGRGAATLVLLVDGVEVSSDPLPPGRGTSVIRKSIRGIAGAHAIRVKARAGTVSLKAITVKLVTGSLRPVQGGLPQQTGALK